MHIQLALSLCFYSLYSLSKSCDGNDVVWRHSMLMKQFSSLSRKYRILSLQILCPLNSPVDPETRSTTEFGDWYRNVCIVLNTYMFVTPAIYHKTSTQLSMEKAIVHAWTSAKLKPTVFRANILHNRLFSEPPTVYRGKHVLRHFRCSHLKANKI